MTARKAGRRQTQVVLNEDGTRAEVINMAAQAHLLRLRGKSWPEIAVACDYANASNAQNAVHRMLLRAATELDNRKRAAQLVLEMERLDKLQDAYWDAAMDGNLFAAQFVLRVIEYRVRMLRLGEPDVAAAAPAAALVIAGSQEQYVAGLRKVVEISQGIDAS